MNSVPTFEFFGIGADERGGFSRASSVPGDLENRVLRQAVQANLVSFPSQVPGFGKQSRPDLRQKIVLLYFVFGWKMGDIAKRYGLGRQRTGQILTAWRIRAVTEGYIQAIDPEHPLFQRIRAEQTSESAEMPIQASSFVVAPQTDSAVLAADVDEPPLAIPVATELSGSNLGEQLHAIVGIVDNQLLLCSKPLNGNIDSCEPLLARAKTLCALLEAQVSATRTKDDGQTSAAISAAKKLFQRFQEHAVNHSSCRPVQGRNEIEQHSFVPPAPRRARHTAMRA
jgi:hypothetical protein